MKSLRIFSFLLVLSLSLAGCGESTNEEQSVELNVTDKSVVDEIQIEEEKIRLEESSQLFRDDNEKINSASNSTNEQDCKSIQDEEAKLICLDAVIINKAVQGNDKTICENIENLDTKAECFSALIN